MNPYFGALVSVITPFLLFLFPGIVSISINRHKHILNWGARVVLLNITTWILATTLITFVGLSLWWAIAGIFLVTLGYAIVRRQEIFSLPHSWYVLAIVVPLVLGFALFAVPLLKTQDGLPSGDSEKAIFWAQDILQSNHLPNYTSATARLNRDPVDFYTPGLHAVVAAVMKMSPSPLISVSFFSILCALGAVLVACAMGKDLFDTQHKLFPAILVVMFVVGNIRFLRYVREPGYHVQNALGELLLFGLLMLGLSLIHRWHTKEAIAATATIGALLLSHQFSSFIGAIILLPALVVFLIGRRHIFFHALRTRRTLLIAIVLAIILMIGGGMALGLQEKIPHLFTTHPHLTNELPAVGDYPDLLGTLLLVTGLPGLVLFSIHIFRRHPHYREGIAFVGATLLILCLSQGPRLFIDIPPVRALFYAVIPLGICAAYFMSETIEYISAKKSYSLLSNTAIVAVILVGTIANITSALASANSGVRTDSSLDSELLSMAQTIEAKQQVGTVVIDDYNRRSASWLTLGNHPVFSRLASEGTRQQAEASQSSLRSRLFLTQLDVEKMYSLGNWPGIAALFAKYNVMNITGIANSSTNNFIHNPNLRVAAWADDVTLFDVMKSDTEKNQDSEIAPWLLRPSTIANDIGDDEDTFDHLPASISAPRLSNAEFDGKQTYRTSRAPIITLRFNEGDYVASLWNKDGDATPDTALEFYIRFAYPSKGVALQLGSKTILLNTADHSLIRIEQDDIPEAVNGFIDLHLINPYEEPVAIDMIALGLARTP